MISEKEMMIVDAVNITEARIESDDIILETIRFHQGYHDEKVGSVCIGCDGFNEVYYKEACTIEEYNQCIEEMSEGAFVPNAKPGFVYGQDVYVNDDRFAKSSLKFGCLSLDGKSAILLAEGSYISWSLSGISSKPFKTKEEIELEEAELDQLNRILEKHSGKFLHPNQFKRAISEMQKDGELAEVLLPLEKK